MIQHFEMRLRPSASKYIGFINKAFIGGDIEAAWKIFDQMLKNIEVSSDTLILLARLEYIEKWDMIDKYLSDLEEQNHFNLTNMYGALIDYCVTVEESNAVYYFNRMIKQKVNIGSEIYENMMRFHKLHAAPIEKIFALMKTNKVLTPKSYVLAMKANRKSIERVSELFEETKSVDMCNGGVYHAYLRILLKHSKFDKALEIYEEAQSKGFGTLDTIVESTIYMLKNKIGDMNFHNLTEIKTEGTSKEDIPSEDEKIEEDILEKKTTGVEK